MSEERNMQTGMAQVPPKLLASVSPHIRSTDDIQRVMFMVVLALMPSLVGAIYFFGLRALWLTLTGIVTAVAAEALCQKLRGRPITVHDGSAIITGILLAFNLPPGVPYWMVVVGAAFGIIVGKQVFGGLGSNPLNPALLGRAVLMFSWPMRMTTNWITPKNGTLSGIDALTMATPLNVLKEARRVLADPMSLPDRIAAVKVNVSQLYGSHSLVNLFWGNRGGSLGETSVALLALGAILLFALRVIDWRIPLTYLASVGVLGWVFGGTKGFFTGFVPFQLLSGGLILGAFYMATDYVTAPITTKGRLLFGTGCGIITVLIRSVGGYPEGVCFAILLMNCFAPLIDHWTVPRKFGFVGKKI
jgi:electron transport complex protein RnfD